MAIVVYRSHVGVVCIISRWSDMLFFFQAEDGIRDVAVTGVQTCALPISCFILDTSKVFSAARASRAAPPPRIRPPVNIACLRFLLAPTTRAWWTGKDSNLRSPQGAADLQSAGFSHSPTRPANFSDANHGVPNFFRNDFQTFNAKTQIGLVSRDTSPLAFAARFRSASLPQKNSAGAGGGN